MKVIVNISDMAVTNRENDVLITYALGSCIGLAVFDKKKYGWWNDTLPVIRLQY